MSTIPEKEDLLKRLRNIREEIEEVNNSSEFFDEDYIEILSIRRKNILNESYSKTFGHNVRCLR